MCKHFGYSKQAFYKHLRLLEQKTTNEELVVGLVKNKRQIWKRGSGRNLYHGLKPDFAKQGIKLGRDKFFDILRNNNLLIKPKRLRAKTTCSYHHFNKYSNLVEGKPVKGANQIWVADITYIWLKAQDKFCYLSLITDLYSRKIVGACVHNDLSVNGSLKALKQAIKQTNGNTTNLIHHSDRGVQYCCHEYVKQLQHKKIAISMTQTGDPRENPVAERINRTIKEEFTEAREMHFQSLQEAKQQIKIIIKFYNHQRPHRSVEWLTPNLAHQQNRALKRVWKNYYQKRAVGGDLTEAWAEE